MIRYFERSDKFEDLLKIFELRTESSMHTENLLIDQGADWHDIEDIRESFPKFDIVFSFT